MRLVTYKSLGTSRVGVLNNEDIIDPARALALQFSENNFAQPLRRAERAIPSNMLDLLAQGQETLAKISELMNWIESKPVSREKMIADGIIIAPDNFTFDAPIPRPGKVMAIGVNYRAHAAEMERELPEHPTVFTKVSSCIVGTGHPIHHPKVSNMLDWEGELCVVIGKKARNIKAENAMDYVAGFMNGGDITVRDWQRHTPTWMMGKSWDTHGPTGPWILTSDEVPSYKALHLKTYINDVEKQSAPVSDLLFDVETLIEYLSTAFTLEPGDVIFTGTPAGVGQAREPQEWLVPGDTIRIEITGLGSLVNQVINYEN